MSERLSAAGTAHIVCVATGYGELVMQPDRYADIRQGRLDRDEMKSLIEAEADIVFDATHPYAAVVSENIRGACADAGRDYVRVLRAEKSCGEAGTVCGAGGRIRTFADAAACAEALRDTTGNILLTTGSKELRVYAEDPGVRGRLFARVLPSEESIRLCSESGLSGRQVIAMQGPFSKEMDAAMIRQFDISILVTKLSGRNGGYDEKIMAAEEAGIQVFVIGRPASETGLSVNDALSRYFGIRPVIQADLIGTGPGKESLMTADALDALDKADVIFGAARMIGPYRDRAAYPYYLARDIVPVIDELKPQRIAVLFSGDTGFFSGAARMKPELENWLDEHGYDHKIRIHPGISSLAYFAAKTGVQYSGAELQSIHGRSRDAAALAAVIEKIRHSAHTFLLLSGPEDVRLLGGYLLRSDLSGCSVTLGRQLSYPDETIRVLTAAECETVTQAGLYIALVTNPEPAARELMPVIADDRFIRGKVPMTKENIRHLSLIRLGLTEGAVLYDVGSGTGSVACDAAALSSSVRVYAIEMKEEACGLIRQNADQFGLDNITVIEGKAPEAFVSLEPPTHVFVGGSSGNLREILRAINETGKGVRVVINAVSLETIAEINTVLRDFDISDLTVEQISVSRSRELGSYHLMTAENPVLIASFRLGGAK